MDTIDFNNDPEATKKASDKSNENEDAIQSLGDLAGLENSQETEDTEMNLDDSAVVLFEDENNIFTTEGIISKDKSQTIQNKQDTSSDAEPGKDSDGKILGKYQSYDELEKAYKELETKLGQKSQAAEKLRELQPVLPMLEAMLSDDTFLGLAEDYFTDPEKQKEALRSQLGIDDDYVFDLNNALSDPKSEDAKILNKVMQAKAPKKQPTNSQTENSQYNEADKKALMEKYDLGEKEFNEMMSNASDYKISYEDIYFLLNKEKILAEREKKAQKAIKEQMGNAQRFRKSPSPSSKRTPDKSPEDSFMEMMQGEEGLFAG